MSQTKSPLQGVKPPRRVSITVPHKRPITTIVVGKGQLLDLPKAVATLNQGAHAGITIELQEDCRKPQIGHERLDRLLRDSTEEVHSLTVIPTCPNQACFAEGHDDLIVLAGASITVFGATGSVIARDEEGDTIRLDAGGSLWFNQD